MAVAPEQGLVFQRERLTIVGSDGSINRHFLQF